MTSCFTHVTLASTGISVVVCLSVTSRCFTETAKRRIMQTMPQDSPGSLFSDAENLGKTQAGHPNRGHGWNVITRAVPSWWHVNLGTTYLNVPLATVHHLYNVCSCCCSFTSSWIFSFTFTGFIELSLLLSYWCQLQPQSAWILCGLLDGVSCTFLLWYHQPCCGIVHCVPKKWTTKLMVVTLSNLNRFSKFFHC